MKTSPWWILKVLCSSILIVGIFFAYLSEWYPRTFEMNAVVSAFFVLVGGSIFLYHYHLIKRKNRQFDEANELITIRGLFPYIRHPMYFGEIFMMFGYALMAGNFISFIVFIVGAFSLIKQSQVEDVFLANKHKATHADWLQSTKLIIPGLY